MGGDWTCVRRLFCDHLYPDFAGLSHSRTSIWVRKTPRGRGWCRRKWSMPATNAPMWDFQFFSQLPPFEPGFASRLMPAMTWWNSSLGKKTLGARSAITKSEFGSLKLPPAPVDGAEHRHLRQLPAAPEGSFKCFTRRRLKLWLTQGNAALRTLVLTIEAVSQKASSTNTLASMVKSTCQGLVNQSSTTATIHVAVSCCHFSADAIWPCALWS